MSRPGMPDTCVTTLLVGSSLFAGAALIIGNLIRMAVN